MRFHDQADCAGFHCPIHNPSDHPLKSAPLNWRADWGVMERICKHGQGHADPDHVEYVRRTWGDEAARADSTHGCDGCCYASTTST